MERMVMFRMKNMVRFFGIIAITAIIALAFAACAEPEDGGSTSSLPALTGTVSITGTAEVGQTLTANTGTLGGSGDIAYQWKRGATDISGANGNTYAVQAADVGSRIAVAVTRSGNSGSVASEPTALVTDPRLPALSGTVSVGGTGQPPGAY